MTIELFVTIFSNLIKVLGIIFFLFSAYDGTFGGQGSTSVFIGTGVLLLVILGSYFVDKLSRVN